MALEPASESPPNISPRIDDTALSVSIGHIHGIEHFSAPLETVFLQGKSSLFPLRADLPELRTTRSSGKRDAPRHYFTRMTQTSS